MEYFLIYAPKQLKISPMQFERYETEITVILPKNSCGCFTLKFKTDEIEQICSDKQRIWIGILNRSLTEKIVIKKQAVWFFFYFRVHKQKGPHQKYQRGGFLKRYDFASDGRDAVNKLGKTALGLIKNDSFEINNIAQQTINQIIRQGGKEVERALPKILRGAIEDVY